MVNRVQHFRDNHWGAQKVRIEKRPDKFHIQQIQIENHKRRGFRE